VKKKLVKTIDIWAPPFVWALFIFSFSSLPTNPVSEIHWKDFVVKKTAHFVIYGILTILIFRALRQSGRPKGKAALYSIVASILYGVTDEFHQSFTPGRDPKLRDVFFDALGSFSSIYIIWYYLPKGPKKIVSLAKKLKIS